MDYAPGADDFWDRLGGGEQWGAIDGVVPGVRIYVTWGEQATGHLAVTGLCVKGNAEHPVNANLLRAIPIGRLEAAPNEYLHRQAVDALKQVKPLGRRNPRMSADDFYRLVATHYRWHAAVSKRPAARMAEAGGVPVSTVHRWIREARSRGHLPPGHQGRAG